MRVLDTSFLVDYGNGIDATAEYLLAHVDERFLIPAPVYVEYLLGTVHSRAPTDIGGAESELRWARIVGTTRETAVAAARVADEIGPQGPKLTAVDALVAGVARQLDATVVSDDDDLTHPETRAVIDAESYA